MNNKNIESLKEEKNLNLKDDITKEKKILKKEDVNNLDVKTLEEKIQKYKNEIKEIKLRTQAEIENIRRRTDIDIEKAHKFALERFCHDLLPVVDSLERALELSDKSNDKVLVIAEGIELTLKVLLNTIKKFGIKVLNNTNVVFNPEIHQAISTTASKDIKPNHVITIIQKGYTINDRLLRPAMVIVSKSIKEKEND